MSPFDGGPAPTAGSGLRARLAALFRFPRWLFLLVLVAGLCFMGYAWWGSGPRADANFLVKPYVQLGYNPQSGRDPSGRESLAIMWATDDVPTDWTVDSKRLDTGTWRPPVAPQSRLVSRPAVKPMRIFQAVISDLMPGEAFEYRLLQNGQAVFSAAARARKPPDEPSRFAVFGDLAAGTPGQRKIAYQAYEAQPDYVFLAGDIVYEFGRTGEYLRHYFPVYNADQAAPNVGAPLLRSTLFLSAAGNHDIDVGDHMLVRNLTMFPDALAWFLFWSEPLDGPLAAPADMPQLVGPRDRQQAFLAAAGGAFPRMANFSFDYGNCHWTVLDANAYMDWTNPDLRRWVKQDLAGSSATWRFVGFHQASFNSDEKDHYTEQRMRLLCDVFEQAHVDVVFSGHIHNYQRTLPLHFHVLPQKDGKLVAKNGAVEGKMTLDKRYDGIKNTRPDGVIYLISGAGGAPLDGESQNQRPATWQPYTHTFVANTHSLTVCDVHEGTLTVRQISEDGEEVDHFTVTK